MRRKLDKGMADLEKLSKLDKDDDDNGRGTYLLDHVASDINFSKASFELRAKSVLWFLVHGTRTIIVMWFARQATFYLPKGWFGPAEWFLWMPLAPKGKAFRMGEGQGCKPNLIIIGIRCCECSYLDVGLSSSHQAISEHVQ